MYALNFYSPIVAEQLRSGRKTATIRLGDKSAKYRKGMIVQVLAGARFSPRDRVFAAVIDKLDTAIADSINSIPEDQKKLLTYHDSFAYFSRRYGIPVLGAVQPSDFSEPSPQEIQALIEQVKVNHVPAIFGSEVFPSTVLKQVADEAHAQYVDKLRDDELPGNPGAPNHTYVGLMVDDVQMMTKALGGDPAPLSSVPTTRTWQA